ncbi:MAG: DUF4926 domain-containing protein [Acetobacteraceae bacterium]|nr:DUF4926 domain-containing protein [Acetobacteraceae bacterium]
MIASLEVHRPALLDVVALLIGRPDLGLPRGAAGTVVDTLDDATSLVEFSDDTGEAQAIVACPHRGLRVLSSARG